MRIRVFGYAIIDQKRLRVNHDRYVIILDYPVFHSQPINVVVGVDPRIRFVVQKHIVQMDNAQGCVHLFEYGFEGVVVLAKVNGPSFRPLRVCFGSVLISEKCINFVSLHILQLIIEKIISRI